MGCMQIHLICIGSRMPAWVDQGFADYARRLPSECGLRLIELALGQRSKEPVNPRALDEEGRRMLAAIPRGAWVVALDERGRLWNTLELGRQLESWLGSGRDTVLLVGGPDGLAPACRQRADTSWSLSALTLPHGLVRILVAEQLYRAWSLLRGHPYHRAG